MIVYHHTQHLHPLILLPILLAVAVPLYFGISQSLLVGLAVSGILSLVVVLFYRLAVTVDQQTILLRFGIGLIHKRIQLSEVVAVREVRNKWIFGWGIRFIPGGMLYNISGLDAVELTMTNGSTIRVGTDEPRRLCAVIARHIS
jgi:hypothetical protein